jgi:hypothetical protein
VADSGLSVAYCGRIRRGEEVPHERWWPIIMGVRYDGKREPKRDGPG